MKTNRSATRLILCISALFATVSFLQTPLLLAQTPVKSSREARLRRIEEHRQIRQRTMELTRDLRRLHLTPEQKSEIRQVLARYNTNPNRHAANTGGPTNEPETQGCGPIAPQTPAAERMTAEILQVLTSEQSDKLNHIKQEREERAQRGPDFEVRKRQ